MIPNIGPMEIALVVGLALIVFGPKRLPGLGRSLGSGIRGFRHEIDGIKGDRKEEPELQLAEKDERETVA